MLSGVVLEILLLCFYGTAGASVTKVSCGNTKTRDSCSCSYGSDPGSNFPVLKAICTRIELTSVPQIGGLQEPHEIDLSFNQIEELVQTQKLSSFKLRRLILRYNRIEKIDSEWFDQVANIEYLDFSSNKLVTFANSNVFSGLKRLKVLNLSHNNLATLPSGIFSTIPQIQDLDLSYNYIGKLLMNYDSLLNSSLGIAVGNNIKSLKLNNLEIPQIPARYFDGLDNLNHLTLANNPLEQIPLISETVLHLDLSGSLISELHANHLNYKSLKVLKLNRLRNLEEINHYAFYNLRSLEVLEMKSCDKLKDFSELAFGLVTEKVRWSLKRISFARSGLRRLNSTLFHLFDKLEHVDLQNNLWTCDCDILWLKELRPALHKEENMR